MISVWFRPHHWSPGRTEPALPLQVHFDLKRVFELPEAVISDNTVMFGEPVRPGDRLRTWQVLRNVSTPKKTKLGTGRFWDIDVEYVNQRGEWVGTETLHGLRLPEGCVMAYRILTAEGVKPGDALPELAIDVKAIDIVLGAMASRDWRPQHHDYQFATNNNGVRDIFMNTPNLAAWFERYVTDWTGPYGRMGWIRFRMKDSVFPGETMVFTGAVKSVDTRCARLRVGRARAHAHVGRPRHDRVHGARGDPGDRGRQPVEAPRRGLEAARAAA